MAKTAKLKKRQATVHSRAARRAASPSIDLDKSLKPTPSEAKAPPNVDPKPHVLAAQSSGVTKRSQSKQLKRQQNLRRLKGMERADNNVEKLALKRQKSLGREKVIRERAKGWDEVNGEKVKAKSKNAFNALAEEEDDEPSTERKVWGDEEMANAEEDTAVVADISGEVKQVTEVEDEIL
ncbi:hypothetical protein BU24DRAFT_426557 [Aaosphaeria arxii CBS 175.79]|uniref:Ribosome biogenesis protein Alb1 n=1 Tax=Aaosphaeria arxii CBS 175.79 TaxID=1450172 RepID=A0A6A5XF39_9PLEO|nr:uncharacterized protein BU24DRAFT_426557 [Aaosphaeria arxii CBS 175.79]KAF2011471.1 hypothetical protein BU24DRAFT_426557 [Aaosphaeria arxii CBS 175.79]